MMNFDKINQLTKILPKNGRLPLNSEIHQLAYCDHSLKLLSTSLDTRNHIAFLVLQPEQIHLLSTMLIHAVHCIIVKGSGVILSANCSLKTEEMLENFAKWAPYLKVQEDVQLYSNKFKKSDHKRHSYIYAIP
jgi:hypothetical protein